MSKASYLFGVLLAHITAHSPDNTFLGFVTGKKLPKNITAPIKKKTALVYGKHYYMWKVSWVKHFACRYVTLFLLF